MDTWIEGYRFVYVCDILPYTDDRGKIIEFYPQQLYENKDKTELHKYGRGPFCKFKIPDSWTGRHGVYAILVEEQIVYIGECENLSSRYNTSYGNISPRNCYVGGQSTNCKVNLYILNEIKSSKSVRLYFHDTLDRFSLEDKLIERFLPAWNSKSGNKHKCINSLLQDKKLEEVKSENGQQRIKPKYNMLTEYLISLNSHEITLLYTDMERIIQGKLPDSAYEHRPWWGNGGHRHANYWLNAGWQVNKVELGKYVVFTKKQQ